ncbi:MAG: hypothetical protein IKT94_03520 [Rikenellaceae bacterium]|nr:hypothetical protein [Rikenellaceae bacterium]
MKRIKLTLLAAAALLVTISASAQPFGRMSCEEQAEQITKQLTRELKLDAKQSKRVEKIYTTFFDAMQASRPQMGQFPPMGGPGGGPFGGMPPQGLPQGGFPNMGNGEFPPMGQFPGMMDEEVSQNEMDKAIKKRDKNMRKILNDNQYNAWLKFERERMSKDFNRIKKGPREGQHGKGPQHRPQNSPQGQHGQQGQRVPQRGQFPQR